MRLWSLHPEHLDRAGLLAVWREGLLAQKVLAGATRGYRHHPQLERFQAHANPVAAIGWYLDELAREAERRGYRFDREKILSTVGPESLQVTDGQLRFERNHLLTKLHQRDPARARELSQHEMPLPHPLFEVVPGPVAMWERP